MFESVLMDTILNLLLQGDLIQLWVKREALLLLELKLLLRNLTGLIVRLLTFLFWLDMLLGS